MRSLAVVAACVLASVLWLIAFSTGARYLIMMPALSVVATSVLIIVLVFMQPVRARLKPKLRDVLWGVGVGGACVAATVVMYPLITSVAPSVADDVRFLYKLMPATWASIPIILLVVAAEELLWRGALFDALRADHPVLSAVVLLAMLYGAAQLGLGVPLLGVLGVGLGALWAAEAALTGGLVAPLISHAIWTIAVFGVIPLEKVGR